MPKRMGRALLAALHRQGAPPPGPKSPVLGNPQRRRVFQFLCLHPSSPIAEIAKALGLSPATVRFHALRLVQAEYLVPAGSSFVPAGLVEPDDVPLFRALASASARRVLAAAYAGAGLPVGELAGAAGMSRQAVASLLDTFSRLRLVSRVADGRYARVYATRTLEEKRERHRARAGHFCDALLQRLEAEGQAPEVLRRTPSEFQVRLGRGSAKASIQLSIEPYSSLLLE